MKSERNILVAFILNFTFSIFEFVGGIFTGSVAIISDSLHDLGDATSIGISYFLEKKSKRQPDDKYTYGYGRYSVLGSVTTTLILLLGSVMVIYNATNRIIHPTEIDYNGMILFAIFGVFINFSAALFTHGGNSLNQKAVNLHMLEDVLGWIVVLVGAIVMKFTNIVRIDPVMSIGVAVFILVNAIKNLKEALDLFLEKTPRGTDVDKVKEHIVHIDGVLDVHHIHIWSMDGQNNCATMHIVTNSNFHEIKEKIREELHGHGITHTTLELESEDEPCDHQHCAEFKTDSGHNHHHHH